MKGIPCLSMRLQMKKKTSKPLISNETNEVEYCHSCTLEYFKIVCEIWESILARAGTDVEIDKWLNDKVE